MAGMPALPRLARPDARSSAKRRPGRTRSRGKALRAERSKWRVSPLTSRSTGRDGSGPVLRPDAIATYCLPLTSRHGRRREDVLLELLRGPSSPSKGDEATIDTISRGPEAAPDRSRFLVQPERAEDSSQKRTDGAGHILTGPVAVSSAEPGPGGRSAVTQTADGSRGIHSSREDNWSRVNTRASARRALNHWLQFSGRVP
jgi:hypothetical protein